MNNLNVLLANDGTGPKVSIERYPTVMGRDKEQGRDPKGSILCQLLRPRNVSGHLYKVQPVTSTKTVGNVFVRLRIGLHPATRLHLQASAIHELPRVRSFRARVSHNDRIALLTHMRDTREERIRRKLFTTPHVGRVFCRALLRACGRGVKDRMNDRRAAIYRKVSACLLSLMVRVLKEGQAKTMLLRGEFRRLVVAQARATVRCLIRQYVQLIGTGRRLIRLFARSVQDVLRRDVRVLLRMGGGLQCM